MGGRIFTQIILKKLIPLSLGMLKIEVTDSNGKISGIVGRYSGQLVLNFQKDDDEKISSLTFNCKKFEMKEKKF